MEIKADTFYITDNGTKAYIGYYSKAIKMWVGDHGGEVMHWNTHGVNIIEHQTLIGLWEETQNNTTSAISDRLLIELLDKKDLVNKIINLVEAYNDGV